MDEVDSHRVEEHALAGTSSTLPTHGATDAGDGKELLLETIWDVLGDDAPVRGILRSRRVTKRTAYRPLRGPICSRR